MKRSRFTEEQIMACCASRRRARRRRRCAGGHGISSATFYKWKAKYGGMEVSDAKRLKALEEENGKLKRLLADAMLDNAALKDLWKKVVTPAAQRKAVAHLARPRDERAAGVHAAKWRVWIIEPPAVGGDWNDAACAARAGVAA